MEGGHLTKPSQEMTYRSVILQDTMRILLTIYVLNGIDIRFFDIWNLYMNKETYDKVYFIAGKEFFPEVDGTPTMVVKAIYALN